MGELQRANTGPRRMLPPPPPQPAGSNSSNPQPGPEALSLGSHFPASHVEVPTRSSSAPNILLAQDPPEDNGKVVRIFPRRKLGQVLCAPGSKPWSPKPAQARAPQPLSALSASSSASSSLFCESLRAQVPALCLRISKLWIQAPQPLSTSPAWQALGLA